jgi:hypothetical protein
VDEQVELSPERCSDLLERTCYVLVRPHVALGHERAVHALGEVADALLDALPLEGEGELRAACREPAGDAPGDRALVRDAQDEAALAGERVRGHGGRV